MLLQNVYFYWICRDKHSFEWFQDLLSSLEEQSLEHFLQIRIFLTQYLTFDEVNKIYINDGINGMDIVTGLKVCCYLK